jgi:hypothetical protein
MPWMPEKMPSLPNGTSSTTTNGNGIEEKVDKASDIKFIEKRILSSSENLNEILTLNSFIIDVDFFLCVLRVE